MAFLGFANQAHYLSLYRHTLKLTQQGKVNEISILFGRTAHFGFCP